MKQVIFAGPYNESVRTKVIKLLGDTFELKFITAQEQLLEHPEAECVVLRTLRMDAKEIDSMPALQFIQRWGAGYDTVDIEYAGGKSIPVANVAGGNAPAVAEQTVNLMLAALRNTAFIDKNIRQGNWNIRTSIDSRSFMLRGKTVGLLGAGNIGRQVAKIVQAFGAQVIYYDAYKLSNEFESQYNLKYVDFDTVLKESDIISVHVPRNDETYHLIDEAQFALMKNTAILVNTARGGIINEAVLYEYLKDNKIMAAAMDCFEKEPLSFDDPLLSLDNMTVSCHVGGNTADIGLAMADMVCDNVIAFNKSCLNEKAIVNKNFIK